MNLQGFITMFTGLKNKIKEETGNDVNLISSIVNSNQPKLIKGRHSRQGSTTSLGSFSIDGNREDSSTLATLDIKLADGKVITPKEFKKLESKEEEWRRKLQKKEEELLGQLKKTEDLWKSQLESKEKEWKKTLEKKENEKKKLEADRSDLLVKINKLEESAKKAADYQKKVCQYQEDIDQMEGFQTQEMAKIKHLLLGKEQELAEKEKQLKESTAQSEAAKAEVVRLRKFEAQYEDAKDDLEALRHESDLEKAQLSSNLAQREEDVRHLRDRVAVLEQRSNAECVALGAELTVDERVQALFGERTLLERRLEEAHLHLSEIKTTWSGKITSLETQVGRLCRQASEESGERRRAELECDKLNSRITELEEELEKMRGRLDTKSARLERLVAEKAEVMEELRATRGKLSDEVEGLRRAVDSADENALSFRAQLSEREKELETAKAAHCSLSESLGSERERTAELLAETTALKAAQDADGERIRQMSAQLERERREKDEMMMRNAQVSQEVELAKQELREQGLETSELQSRMESLERKVLDKDKDLDRVTLDKTKLFQRIQELEKLENEKEAQDSLEQELRSVIAQLEGDLLDKNKSIKMLQQRLTDMKKTLQRELKFPAMAIDPGGADVDLIPPYAPSTSSGTTSMAVLAPSSSLQHPPSSKPACRLEEGDDVNFKYLKHVLIKFLTSREYEAQHLTRAVATLLRFSAEEERLLRETLEWKMSWFGTRPNLGNGQTAKTIPPS